MLFDHSVPRKLKKRLRAHLVTTAAQMGWAQLSNGLLIQSAEAANFEVFVTGDQGILYQQNHALRRILIILISSTYWPDVDHSATVIAAAILAVRQGEFIRVEIPKSLSPRGGPSEMMAGD